MKTFLKMLTGMTAVLFLSGGELKSENYPMMVEDEIIIRQLPVKPTGAPRSLGYNPFFAEVQNGILLLGSSCPYGIVEVMLVSTSGDFFYTQFDTEDGTISIPISGTPGHYVLTLTVESGSVFEGTFDV